MLLEASDKQEPCATMCQWEGTEGSKIKAVKPLPLGLKTPFTPATLTASKT